MIQTAEGGRGLGKLPGVNGQRLPDDPKAEGEAEGRESLAAFGLGSAPRGKAEAFPWPLGLLASALLGLWFGGSWCFRKR